jgi:ribosomal protein S18 acetylase RimI-like enzyme
MYSGRKKVRDDYALYKSQGILENLLWVDGIPNEEKEREGKQENSEEEDNPIGREIIKEDKFEYIFIDEKNKDVYREQVLKWISDDFFSKEESDKHFYHDLDEIASFFNKGQAMVVLNKSSGKELIGYMVWKKEDSKRDRTEITFVEVIEKYRRQGVFKKMLDELRIKLPNVTELSAKVIPQSIQIFKKTGFEVVTPFGNLFYCVKNIRNNIQLRKRERDEEESDNYDSPNVKNPSDGADLNFFIRQRSNDSLSPSSRGLFSSNSSGSSSIPTERVSARLN